MTKEEKWLKQRVGMITASELGNITSASGKIIEGNLSYIRKKRFERAHGFAHNVSSRPMEIGNEQEPMIFEWVKANLGFQNLVYSKDLPEIPFWVSPVCPMGASPDAYTEDESIVFEFKTLVGATSIEFFADEFTSYEEKKAAVWADHGDQILGQFLSNPKVQCIYVVKYIYQDDDIMEDTASPLDPWRGLVFEFLRDDYSESIEKMRERIIIFNAMIDAEMSPSVLKSCSFEIDGDKVVIIKK